MVLPQFDSCFLFFEKKSWVFGAGGLIILKRKTNLNKEKWKVGWTNRVFREVVPRHFVITREKETYIELPYQYRESINAKKMWYVYTIERSQSLDAEKVIWSNEHRDFLLFSTKKQGRARYSSDCSYDHSKRRTPSHYPRTNHHWLCTIVGLLRFREVLRSCSEKFNGRGVHWEVEGCRSERLYRPPPSLKRDCVTSVAGPAGSQRADYVDLHRWRLRMLPGPTHRLSFRKCGRRVRMERLGMLLHCRRLRRTTRSCCRKASFQAERHPASPVCLANLESMRSVVGLRWQDSTPWVMARRQRLQPLGVDRECEDHWAVGGQ